MFFCSLNIFGPVKNVVQFFKGPGFGSGSGSVFGFGSRRPSNKKPIQTRTERIKHLNKIPYLMSCFLLLSLCARVRKMASTWSAMESSLALVSNSGIPLNQSINSGKHHCYRYCKTHIARNHPVLHLSKQTYWF